MRWLRSEVLPWWIVEICHALNAPDAPLDHGAELGLVAAIKDALAWTRDLRPFDPKRHTGAWKSVIDDVAATVDRVGPASRLGEALTVEIERVREQLKVPDGPKSDDLKSNAEVVLKALSFRAASNEAVLAAWEDLIAASQDPSVPAPEWAWRRNLFLELAAHAGRAVRSLASTLGGLLDDRLLEVTMVRARLGEIEAPGPGNWPSLTTTLVLRRKRVWTFVPS